MLSSLSTEDLIPTDHPIRRIRVVVDESARPVSMVTFDAMYAASGRRSVPPETLLKATVLMAMYSIRSERAFCERLNYDMLFKWFLDLRDRRPRHSTPPRSPRTGSACWIMTIADVFFAAVVRPGEAAPLHVVGSFLSRWDAVAGVGVEQELSSPTSPPTATAVRVMATGSRASNAEVDFEEHRNGSNKTHTSTTDPEAMLFRKSNNAAAEDCPTWGIC